ncbi:MAG TPA: nitrilase-related carbon-nitrogen hydrolase [Thermoanaerobaculia bacterium]|nr:nitrilase-related carbon-nitrogen hydrolase [Thermoanaerobaculia bacterium]
MASAADRRRFGAGLLAILSTALLVWFGTGLDPFWPLMWFAPLPVLVFAQRASWWSAALAAALAWLLGNLNLWHYFHHALGLPPFLLARIFATLALVFALAVLLHRALLRRGAPWSALLAFPALWVSFEYLLNLASPHATSGNLAYTQLAFLPFLQLASLAGPWGMSFLLLAFSSAIAVGLYLRATAPRQALRIVGISLGVIGLALVFGAVRLALPAPAPPVSVGLIASDSPTSPEVADAGAPTAKLLAAYAERASSLASRGARVIVLPEKLGVVVDPATRDADAVFQSLADRTRATVVVGLIHVAPPLQYNQARVYAPGTPALSYDKEHMLPPFESKFKPGTALTLLPEPSGTWGVAICKDMDFTPLSRAYGEAGAGLLLVPAWDFGEDRLYHGHMAVMRGVESGFGVVRSAKNGYLTVSDDRGRILAETTSDSAPFATLLAAVPATHDATLYLLWGDWFAWLVLALLMLTLVRCVLLRLR